ncbi:MAG: hypothetical protein ACTSXN_08390 [Promethearchaeota archaeon]
MVHLKILWYRLFKRSAKDKCLQSGYEDIQLMIKEVLINVSKIPCQLSYPEFVYLFEKYDWKDIIEAIEELDILENSLNQSSIFEGLINLFTKDGNIRMINDSAENSYYKELFNDL